MEKLFIDTSAFFAIINARDLNHDIALKFFKNDIDNFKVFSSDFIISETLTLIRRKMGSSIAFSWGEKILQSNFLKILYSGENIFFDSWKTFIKYEDRDFSFVDCTSFIHMKENEIRQCFCFDTYFSIYGYNSLPGEIKYL
ncbi:MAG: PIN domain-containing protein [Actinobacteria bacterium]|nr:PIN domain-containing protein [Actinomycetota bacterium]